MLQVLADTEVINWYTPFKNLYPILTSGMIRTKEED
jgi:hypothetical protein